MNDAKVVDIIASTLRFMATGAPSQPRPQDILRAKAILRALADEQYEVHHYHYEPVVGEYPNKVLEP